MEILATDLKQFVFCPRYVYFTYVQPVPKMPTWKMSDGRLEHIAHQKREKRRGLKSYNLIQGKRYYGYTLYAEKIGLRGKIDIVIDTEASAGQRYYPVECKNTNRGIRNNHLYQLVAYAMALEEVTKTPIKQGFIYIIPEKKAYPILVTPSRGNEIRL